MPCIEKRSIIEVGSKSRSSAVTLPASWIRYYEMMKGEKVTIVYDSVLVVFPRGLTRAQMLQNLSRLIISLKEVSK